MASLVVTPSQKLNSTYKLPINKIPYLGFIGVDYAYTGSYRSIYVFQI